MFPTVPPSRPKIFFGLILAYVIYLVAVGLWMPERLQTLSAILGFVVVFISELIVEATAVISNEGKISQGAEYVNDNSKTSRSGIEGGPGSRR